MVWKGWKNHRVAKETQISRVAVVGMRVGKGRFLLEIEPWATTE